MEIRKPKFNVGDKVIDNNDDIYTVAKINGYSFLGDEYFYNLKNSEKTGVKEESDLEPYVENKKSVWNLQDGDTYYAINTFNGKIYKDAFCDNGYYLGKKRELGDLFLTKEEAESEVERRKIEAKMISLGGTRKINELNSNVVYTIQMHFGLKYVYVRSFDIKQAPIGVIFFNYRKQAIKALETIGEERIKKYIFGVDEWF